METYLRHVVDFVEPFSTERKSLTGLGMLFEIGSIFEFLNFK